MKPRIFFLNEPVLKKVFLDLCTETRNCAEAEVLYVHSQNFNFEDYPKLRCVLCPCTGIGHINVPKNIKLFYLDDKEYLKKFVHSTAEYTIYSMLRLCRDNGDELHTLKIGLIGGAGRIGQQVCDKLYGLTDYPPLVYDKVKVSKAQSAKCIQVDSLEDMYKQCDLISMHLNEMPSDRITLGNENFISYYNLEQMLKYKVKYLINSARSSVLYAPALLATMHRFKGIVLDVIESYTDEQKEQLVNHYLFHPKQNLSLTDHVAGSMKPSRLATDAYVLGKLKKWLQEPKEPEFEPYYNALYHNKVIRIPLSYLDDLWEKSFQKAGEKDEA